MRYAFAVHLDGTEGASLTINHVGIETVRGMVADILEAGGGFRGKQVNEIYITPHEHELAGFDPMPDVKSNDMVLVKIRRWHPIKGGADAERAEPGDKHGSEYHDSCFEGFGNNSIVGYLDDHLDGADEMLTAGVFGVAAIIFPRRR
jgi:hypothetical protein